MCAQAKELSIYDVQPFLKSTLFRTNGYKLDNGRGIISRTFGQGDEDL